MQVVHSRLREKVLVCIYFVSCAAWALSAGPNEVDEASLRFIEALLSDTTVLQQPHLDECAAQDWIQLSVISPWLSEAARAELDIAGDAAQALNQAIRFQRAADSFETEAGLVRYAARERGFTPHELSQMELLQEYAQRARDTLSVWLGHFVNRLGDPKAKRLAAWLDECAFVSAVVETKVEQAFYGQVTFGPGVNAAPDSLESAWRLLEGSQVFERLIDRQVEQSIRALHETLDTSPADSSAVSDLIRDYHLRAARTIAELAVARKTVRRLGQNKTLSYPEALRAYTSDLVTGLDRLRTRLVDLTAQRAGVDSRRLEETWLP